MNERSLIWCAAAMLWMSGCAVGPSPVRLPPSGLSEKFVSQDEPLPSECNLADALSAAWYRHPAMQRAQHRVSAQHGTRVQAGLWPRPDAKVFFLEKTSETETGAILAQKFELGGKRRARVSETAAKVFLEETEMMAEWAAIKADLKRSFARLAFHQESLALYVQLEKIASDYAAMSEALHRAGKLPERKLIEARQSLAIAKSAVSAETSMLRDVEREVLLSVGVPEPEDGVRFTAALPSLSVPDDYTKLLAKARKGSPELAVARVETEVARAGQALARAARSMDATVGLTFKEFSRDEFRDGSAIGAQVSFDLPVWNRGQGSVAASDERALAAEAGEKLTELDLASKLSALLADYTAWRVKDQVYREDVIPLEEKNYRLADNQYRSGTISKLELIEAKRRLEARRVEHLKARFMLSVAGIEMERIALSYAPEE